MVIVGWLRHSLGVERESLDRHCECCFCLPTTIKIGFNIRLGERWRWKG